MWFIGHLSLCNATGTISKSQGITAIKFYVSLMFHISTGPLQLCFSLWLYILVYVFYLGNPGWRTSSYLGNGEPTKLFNVSAYKAHKLLLHTIHWLVKESQWPSLPQGGGTFFLKGVHAGLITREGDAYFS